MNYITNILYVCILKEPPWEGRWIERLSVHYIVPLAMYCMAWRLWDTKIVTILRGKGKERWQVWNRSGAWR